MIGTTNCSICCLLFMRSCKKALGLAPLDPGFKDHKTLADGQRGTLQQPHEGGWGARCAQRYPEDLVAETGSESVFYIYNKPIAEVVFQPRFSHIHLDLYNEERNLRRIQEKERRNQEAHQERESFPVNVPLFGEPYKINKADELSSRIQNMLGSYEQMKALIAAKEHQNLIGIRNSVVSLIPQHKPDHPLFPEKTSNMLPSSFQNSSHHHKPLGPLPSGAPSAGCSAHYQKVNSRIERAPDLQTPGGKVSSSQKQAPEQSCRTQEIQSRTCLKKNEKCIEDEIAKELQASLSELSPLLSTLSSPVAPLSPLHSSQHVSSRPHSSSNCKSHGPKSSPSQDLAAGTRDNGSQDSLSAPGALSSQPPSQTFPSSLPSKTSAIQQKPTAYVRPMDGQDQAPDESPELKPLPEEYHEQSYGKVADIKVNSKAKLPTLKIPTEPIESLSTHRKVIPVISRAVKREQPLGVEMLQKERE
ncbi:UNVERIFIED_CONTAM: hypothetical protein K2H54_022437 [Gekko kuhli]